MQKIWQVKSENVDISEKLAKRYNPIILKLLANRFIQTEEEIENFFHFDYEKNLTDPFSISGMKEAVDRLQEAGEKQEKVAIFGDYDADGVTATAVLFEALTGLGFSNLTYYIPDRQLEGYGMNKGAVEFLSREGVTLIVTVDCGITSFEEVKLAKDLGMDVIITDHHHVLEKIPEAFSIINPKKENSGFKFQDLAGVGVAFKLAQALYQKLAPEKVDQLKWVLDLVCIGTVADCVPLLGENRVLVRYGFIVLSKTRRVGLQEMFQVGRITIDENHVPDTYQVAFQIAPRINASGRVDHASVSYKLIIEKNRVIAREMALEVEAKNQERQKITNQIVKEVEILAQNAFREKKFIIAENEHWPVGLLGLVAGKITDQFSKPTAILQNQGDFFVGSLRSIPVVNIIEVLEENSAVLDKFGGHAQAAGMKIRKDNMGKFYELFESSIEKRLENKEVISSLEIDLEVKAEEIDWDLMTQLKAMEPFGEGNREPVFLMKDLIIEEFRIVGNGNKHLKLALRPKNGSPKIFDSIGFSLGELFPNIQKGDIVNVVFNLREDEWNGNKKMQLRLIDLKKTDF